MPGRSFATPLLVVGLALLGPSGLAAQAGTTTGAIAGQIVDDSGAPLGGAQIVATNLETGFERGALSGEGGTYSIQFLPVGGPYRVVVQYLGFRAVADTIPRVGLNQTVRASYTLQPQAVEVEALVVTAESEIDVTQPALLAEVSEQRIDELPTAGRDFTNFIALTPYVISNVGTTTGGTFSAGGGRVSANNILIDGAEANNTFFGGNRGGSRSPYPFSLEAIEAFQVSTTPYDVSAGRFSGGRVNAITKSGTNDFQGSVFGFFRGDELGKPPFEFQGVDYGDEPLPEYTVSQFGATVGGPIVRDRAHFFFALDNQLRRNPILVDFPALAPASVDELSRILAEQYGIDLAAQSGTIDETEDELAVLGRVDWQISGDHAVGVRYNYTNFENQNDYIFSRYDLVGRGSTFGAITHSAVLNLNSVFDWGGRGVFNEFRVQLASEHTPRTGAALPASEVDVDDRTVNFAGNFINPNDLKERTFQIINNTSFDLGRHQVKVGTDNTRISIVNDFFFARYGFASFSDLEDLEARRPFIYFRSITPDSVPFEEGGLAEPVAWDLAVYAQDNWQMNDRLNLLFGLRYDYPHYTSVPRRNVQFEQDFAALDPGATTARAPEDTDNIAPRLGVTYDLSGNGTSVLRAGVGKFFGRVPFVGQTNSLAQTGLQQLFLFCGGDRAPVLDYNAMAADPDAIPDRCRTSAEAAADPYFGFGFGGGTSVPNITYYSDDFELPETWKANLGYEQQIARRASAGFDVSYANTTNNFFAIDLNLDTVPEFFAEGGRPIYVPPSEINRGEADDSESRINSAYGDVLQQNSIATARTYALALFGAYRISERYTVNGQYTYQDTEDDGSYTCCTAGAARGDNSTSANPNNLDYSRGPADFARRHSLSFDFTAELPFGVNLSGIWRAQSGTPFTAVINGDVNGDGEDFNDRAYIPTEAEISGGDFLFASAEDAAEFQSLLSSFECLQEARGSIIGRNSCWNDWQHYLDVRLGLELPFAGRSVELIADLFNVLNGLNDEWGDHRTVFWQEDLYQSVDFDEVSETFVYEVNDQFGDPSETFLGRADQFNVQLGLRVNF